MRSLPVKYLWAEIPFISCHLIWVITSFRVFIRVQQSKQQQQLSSRRSNIISIKFSKDYKAILVAMVDKSRPLETFIPITGSGIISATTFYRHLGTTSDQLFGHAIHFLNPCSISKKLVIK